MLQQIAQTHVSVAHRYWNGLWSHSRNQQIYGSMASQEGVGSNLKITVSALSATKTQIEEALRELKTLVDHRCLFVDFPQFRSAPSTLEMMTEFFKDFLFAQPLDGQWLSVEVQENGRHICRITPESLNFDMIFNERNLTLKVNGRVDRNSGLLLPWDFVARAVHKEFERFKAIRMQPENLWMRGLFDSLRGEVKGLSALSVDLGFQRCLSIADSSSSCA